MVGKSGIICQEVKSTANLRTWKTADTKMIRWLGQEIVAQLLHCNKHQQARSAGFFIQINFNSDGVEGCFGSWMKKQTSKTKLKWFDTSWFLVWTVSAAALCCISVWKRPKSLINATFQIRAGSSGHHITFLIKVWCKWGHSQWLYWSTE